MILAWIQALDPRWGAVLHALAWVAVVAWVWRRPADEIFEGAPTRSRWCDLRWWVLPLAAIQVALYFVF